ncbi:MAG: CocE/NonD family hydrolase [Actinomycetes bacterium]
MHRLLRAGLAAATGATLLLGTVAATPGTSVPTGGAPTDYIALDRAGELSQPTYEVGPREVFRVPMHDGEELYVEVVRPDPEKYPGERFPVIMEASPYHGTIADRDGTRIFPDPVDASGKKIGLTGFFAPRGYAVVMVDLRGTGRSSGCLDHLGPNDALDLKRIVEWAADREWSTGKVGMTGHSYVGSTPSVAAAQNPRGLETIVPSAGLASMYDHQFQAGVPYLLQYIGPMVAYEALAIDRHLVPGTPSPLGGTTGDNFGNGMDDFGCGMKNSAAISGAGQVTGASDLWHAERDWGKLASEWDGSIFMIHGVNDNAARIPAAEWFFGNRYQRPGDKVWIGQWDHGSTNGRCGSPTNQRVLHPTCRFDQFTHALHAWFDAELKGMDVDTGPAVEAFLNPADRNLAVNSIVDPASLDAKVLTADAWRHPSSRQAWYLDATTRKLTTTEPTTAGTASYTAAAQALLVTSSTNVEFQSDALTEDLVLLGLPQLELSASSTSPQTDIVMTLHNVDPNGVRTPVNTCAIDPSLRFGKDEVAPVIPGEVMTLRPTCFTAAHVIPKGNRLVLTISGNGPHHAPIGAGAQVTIHTGPNRAGAFRLPAVKDPVLYPDVPLRRTS